MRGLLWSVFHKDWDKAKRFSKFSNFSQSCLYMYNFFLLQHNLGRPHVSVYFWIRNFFSGYGFRPHVSGESDGQIRNFLIRCVSGNVLTLNPDFFLFRWSAVHHRESSRRSEQRKICGFKNIRIRLDGQIRFESGYVWTWKRFYPERKSCRFKNIRTHVDGALK